MFDHLGFRVKDLAAARKFYDAVAASLGLATIDNSENSFLLVSSLDEPVPFVWIGTDKPAFWRDSHRTSNSPMHLAFKAKDKPAVDAFYKAALQNGGADNGAPGPRGPEAMGYYGAYVLDPDGNNIEAGFAQAEARSGPQAGRTCFADGWPIQFFRRVGAIFAYLGRSLVLTVVPPLNVLRGPATSQTAGIPFGLCRTPSNTPHPTSLREATFSHKGRRWSFAPTPVQIFNVDDWQRRCGSALPSPLVGEGGRAKRGRMRGAGRSATWVSPNWRACSKTWWEETSGSTARAALTVWANDHQHQ